MVSAAALIAILLPSVPTAVVDTVVVCPPPLRESLDPWLNHRRAQGRSIAVLPATHSAERLRSEIRRLAGGGSLRFIVLVGDADPAMLQSADVRRSSTPTQHVAAKVNVRFGPERDIPSDNWFADLDDDRLPDVAVGRLTADNTAELEQIVQKILQYERCTDFGLWRRRLNFVAGLGGFGPIADFVLEASTKRLIADGVPAAYQTTMTHASWRSPYCPDPRLFQSTTVGRLNEGCLFWVYIGHGHKRNVDWLRVPGGAFPILSDRDLSSVRCQSGSPIACFLACYTAAFDQTQDCLAEEMLRTPGCPVAIIGGSRVTMPYAMACLGSELLGECFARRSPTLGEAMLRAKRGTMQTKSGDAKRAALDALAKALSPAPANLEEERAEHLDLFTLIGDPLLTLEQPSEVKVQLEQDEASPGTILATIASPIAGACTIELVTPRDRLRFNPPKRGDFQLTADSLAEYSRTYRAANDDRWTTVETSIEQGTPRTIRLSIPPEAHGSAHLRAFVQGTSACAVGAVDVDIAQLPKNTK